jgi:hypothetical protein
MKPKKRFYLLVPLLAGLLLAVTACGPAQPQTPTVDTNLLITQAAATVSAQFTQEAALTPSPTATSTPAPTNPPLPTNTPAQAAPTAASSPTATTAQSNPTGDAGSFIADVTVPDGTAALPGSTFNKTWRVKNTGVTTWDTAYTLVVVDGNPMGAPANGVALPKAVRPGEEVDVTVSLTAPVKPGTYQTYFRFRSASGHFFRLDGTGDLWVKIIVGGAEVTPNLTQTAAYTPGVTSTGTAAPTLTPQP